MVSETAAVIDASSPMTRRGLYNLDPARKGFGYGVNGAMTRHVRVPARILHRIPEALSFEQACLTEPCCVAYSAVVKNARIEPGDRVVVFGPGTIGILCAAMARLCGAEVAVVGLEHDVRRLAIVRQYGCDGIVGDPTPWAMERDGLGCDGVIDAAGVSATLQVALKIVRPAGWISKVGWGPQPLGFNLDPLVQKNVKLQGSFQDRLKAMKIDQSLVADYKTRAVKKGRMLARTAAKVKKDGDEMERLALHADQACEDESAHEGRRLQHGAVCTWTSGEGCQ